MGAEESTPQGWDGAENGEGGMQIDTAPMEGGAPMPGAPAAAIDGVAAPDAATMVNMEVHELRILFSRRPARRAIRGRGKQRGRFENECVYALVL